MDDPFFDDPFLDDYDLFIEGLLSEADARRMYQRGEITLAQLNAYLAAQRGEGHRHQEASRSPWIVALAVLGIILLCLCLITQL